MVLMFMEEEVRVLRFGGIDFYGLSKAYVAEAEWYWTKELLSEDQLDMLNQFCVEQIEDLVQEYLEW